jgi:hypothetical protein
MKELRSRGIPKELRRGNATRQDACRYFSDCLDSAEIGAHHFADTMRSVSRLFKA